MVLRPSAPCRVVGMELKDLGLLRGHLARDSAPCRREQNQKSKPTLGVTMMHHATKRGFKDCPGFLNSTGRLGPKRGRKCYITPAFSGGPQQRGTKSEVKNLRYGSP